jgi:uncharacterized protein involved in exopolysaccharide biosynthesis
MNDSNLRNTTSAAAPDPSLRDLLMPLFRRKRLLALSFLGILLGAICAALILSNQYKASMEILVNRERLDPMVTSEATVQTPPTPPPVTEDEINSEVEMLKSPDLLGEVVLANGLQKKEKGKLSGLLFPQREDAWYVSKAAERLGKTLDIQAVKKTDMIAVSYQSTDPKLAYGVLNKLANLYMERHLAVHRPVGSSDFFANETAKYQKALADSEMRLASFGKTMGVVAPEVERTDMAQQVVNSVAALHQAQQTIAADQQRIVEDAARMKATPERSSTQQVSNSAASLLQQLEANLLAARIKRTQLALKYDSSYPLVQEADQEIAQTQAAINDAEKASYVNQTTDRDPTYELLREDVARTQVDLAFQQANKREVERSIQSMQRQMVDLDQNALKQGDLVREVKANEATYLLYLSKREQERTSDALDEKRIGNVAIAVPPTVPVLPAHSPYVLMLIGLFAAAFVSVGSTFVAEYLDPSFRTPAEVVQILRIPVLASVAKQKVS